MVVPALLFSPGPWELAILLVIIMMFFGVGKLPQVGKALGNSLRAFKEAQKTPPLDVTESTEELAAPATSTADEAETL
ncbi:MAG: twin-arginine translocase TatA/TatE family subunit [Rickettsiales bacterium]|nr:twin-arginine translocase TatA/TatE family subunit [Rickettsiales bacterium]|tara:strand:+ start:2140 stop:2373 length:234 start_codon:yes stop_codon:yes gene_type:complete